MAIGDEFLQELREKIDIETVVSPYVSLRRRGRLLTGLCPFHNEKTPSFTVYPDSRSFYCFGCGAGGEIITFVRRIENLDFVEAVKSLAQRAGMQMPDDGFDDTVSKRRADILAANREAAKYFNATLMSPKGRGASRPVSPLGRHQKATPKRPSAPSHPFCPCCRTCAPRTPTTCVPPGPPRSGPSRAGACSPRLGRRSGTWASATAWSCCGPCRTGVHQGRGRTAGTHPAGPPEIRP